MKYRAGEGPIEFDRDRIVFRDLYRCLSYDNWGNRRHRQPGNYFPWVATASPLMAYMTVYWPVGCDEEDA